ncbi:uncharacterized protein BBA_09793 [Beauveria bassiana ARSEF 2860]|uniref:Uncharacterized protein n=1 Tax=Beauveria bassiana (strain ARSEF 2860) TaxID=655819 RepID=J4UFG5_BEAB2|nr:uncharacterized protein BBA_09793 [Beauveria bassiana ARSEF 2860]EJP61257.1 hypothetical protein BBA_09793 [Beauveria bassiana ARSEF 2860]
MPQNNTITTTTTPDTAAPFVALKQPAVEALARILYFSRATASPPKTDAACQRWLRRQKRQIADLDETSLRRPRTLSLLGDVLFRRGGALARRRRPPQETTLEAEGAAALCPSHKRLDLRVLMALMALVAEEVTVWTESGKEKRWWDERNRRGAGEEEEEEEEAAVEVWRKNMAKIAVLWMGRRRWEDEIGRSIGELEVPPCARYRGCCAACKLAVVGGSAQFLMDLRTGLLARRELARGLQDDDEPPLLRMVEAWIDVRYTRRRQRFMRTESDMMVNLLVRMQTSGGGSGGKVSGGRGGGEQRTKYTQFRGWPMPVMQVKVDELIRNAADDDDDDDIEENEYGRGAATQWRRGKRMPEKEGHLQYLPASPRAVPEPWTARRGGTATHNAKRDNADYRRAPPPLPRSPPPPPHVEPPWVTQDYDPPAAATSLAAEPWHADYDDWSIRRQSTWSFSSSSATLSAIYDAYHTAPKSTTTVATSLCAPSPLFTQRGAAAAAEAPRSGAVSPPSPSVYSPVQKSSRSAAAAAAAAAAATTPRWGASARSTRPPLPLHQRRLLSEITVPKRAKTAAAALRPPPLVIVRDPMQSVRLVSSTF